MGSIAPAIDSSFMRRERSPFREETSSSRNHVLVRWGGRPRSSSPTPCTDSQQTAQRAKPALLTSLRHVRMAAAHAICGMCGWPQRTLSAACADGRSARYLRLPVPVPVGRSARYLRLSVRPVGGVRRIRRNRHGIGTWKVPIPRSRPSGSLSRAKPPCSASSMFPSNTAAAMKSRFCKAPRCRKAPCGQANRARLSDSDFGSK
jgi:hypothetical protein